MKEKGFTLVELLATMVLLILIFLLIYPAITNILSKSKETLYEKQINTILSASYDYSLQNISLLPKHNKETYITLGNLKVLGLVDVNISDPNSGIKFDDNVVVSIKNVGTNYSYSDKNSKLEGNYLYTVETNLQYDKNLLPSFEIKRKLDNGSYEAITSDENGNYIVILDLGDVFEDEFFSESKNNTNLTDQVSRYITKDNKMENTIETKVPGIYKINYSVVDDQGYSNFVVLNVIVDDRQLPKINFETKDIILSKDITSYNLLEDVSCEDNSGFCDIDYTGNVDYGVSGKYIIKYTATDPSGNTIEKERIIRIE